MHKVNCGYVPHTSDYILYKNCEICCVTCINFPGIEKLNLHDEVAQQTGYVVWWDCKGPWQPDRQGRRNKYRQWLRQQQALLRKWLTQFLSLLPTKTEKQFEYHAQHSHTRTLNMHKEKSKSTASNNYSEKQSYSQQSKLFILPVCCGHFDQANARWRKSPRR